MTTTPPRGGVRSGDDYRRSLVDGRAVFVDGEAIDVADHPAFSGVISSVAGLYDLALDPANDLLATSSAGPGFVGPDPVNRIYLTPHSHDDLRSWRAAITLLARQSVGFLGRGPDHVAAFFAGFASRPEVFDGDRPFGAHVTDFHARMAHEALFCSYCIIPPSIDRAIGAEGGDETRQVGVVSTSPEGVVLRGTQILGTGSAISDYIFVSCITPLKSGQERHAISLIVPPCAPGLHIHLRRLYAPSATSSWDYPLSARFDESDASVVFHDVLVPWSDTFVVGNIEALTKQFHVTPAHVLGNTQAQIRLTVKLKFLLGVAVRIVEAAGGGNPEVLDHLAELLALAAHIEGMVLASEYEATIDDHGVAVPDRRYLYAAMAAQADLYPRALHLLRLLASSQVINLPSSYHALTSPVTAEDVATISSSPKITAEARIKLFKLAWDAIGSEFASRHHQYEMFYAGAPAVAKNYARRNYRLEEAGQLVDEFLAGYGMPT